MDWKTRLKLICIEQFPRLAENLLMIFFAVLSVRRFLACNAAGQQTGVVFNVIMAWFYAAVAALLLVHLYLPAAAGRITFGLLYPKKYLRSAPPPLSPIYGLIARGCFKEAEQRLSDLTDEYPGHAEIALMMIELYADRLKRSDLAAAAAENYFSCAFDRKGDSHFQILMRSVDLLRGAEPEDCLREWVEKELDNNRLTDSQRATLKRRLDHLYY